MNLIEQLGGYDGAKKKYTERPFELAWSDIGDALLEYRREHGIFEKGDLIIHPMFWGLFRVNETMGHHIIGITTTGYESKLAIQLIRHATPAEIAAGKRLN